MFWLSSLFFHPSLSQDHPLYLGVSSDCISPILWVLLLQRAAVYTAVSAHLLGCTHPPYGHQIPAGQCEFKTIMYTSAYKTLS